MRAYYFADSTDRLRFGDGRKIAVGVTHTVDISKKDLMLCSWGLHASRRALDALIYAPGTTLYIVELSGKILHGGDKSCAERRTYLRKLDATNILKKFAKKQALLNIEKIMPYCSKEDYNLIYNYLLAEETTVEARAAAESAARAAEAAEAAARAAARAAESAARAVAWSTARVAWSAELAWSTARAAESAARAVAWSTAWSVVVRLTTRAARSTARSVVVRLTTRAAEAAAEAAARNAANQMLEDMIEEELKEK